MALSEKRQLVQQRAELNPKDDKKQKENHSNNKHDIRF
jgi:hypothetical protein